MRQTEPAVPASPKEWRPTRFTRQISVVGTSTGPAEIMTDAGRAYLKALGNKEGPHVLASEWVGTRLASWFGLRTFDLASLTVLADDHIELGHNRMALPGDAIAIRAEGGASWDGSAGSLRAVQNVDDLSRLVVFDTWIRNCDRHPPDLTTRKPNPDNLFLSAEHAPKGKFIAKAIDHTHAFNCGRDLDARLARIEHVKDTRVYGLFPQFVPFLDRQVVNDAASDLAALPAHVVTDALGGVRSDWQLRTDALDALSNLITDRGAFVSATIVSALFP